MTLFLNLFLNFQDMAYHIHVYPLSPKPYCPYLYLNPTSI